MSLENKKVKVFKMRNRNGYAAVCEDCLTEGKTRQEALDRMEKAVKRVVRQGR